jgi:hypothetical protein
VQKFYALLVDGTVIEVLATDIDSVEALVKKKIKRTKLSVSMPMILAIQKATSESCTIDWHT